MAYPQPVPLTAAVLLYWDGPVISAPSFCLIVLSHVQNSEVQRPFVSGLLA
jgi:hypothetical protein